ncbi:hypothetical protein LF1_13280 [Rubripirellula obstinata]|uniref:Uncharacterized protein n=2 Tax=Rubripirellula obstinata TaxID=406547 RepID=A0A5B1CHS5_9BACT|nr:hypothetical protein LF1_13280 [Rubripirellula obstinata]
MKYPDDKKTADVEVKSEFSVEELTKTERGRELVDQLRVLRNAEATMGEKHPLLPNIKEQIEQVKGLLRNRVVAKKIADKMDDEDEVKQLATVLPGMTDDDLRGLVLRLIVRVNSLEKEVKALKRRRGNDASQPEPTNDDLKEAAKLPAPDSPDKKEDADDLFDGSLFEDT